MKTPPSIGCFNTLSALALMALIPQSSFAEGYPRGTISVARDLVRISSKVPLNWQIQYPGVTKVGVEVLTNKTLKLTEDLEMQVRVLGASFRTNNGHGNNADGVDSSNPGQGGGGPNGEVDASAGIDDENKGNAKDLPVELVCSKNHAAWERLFYGTQSTMIAANSVLKTLVKAGDVIDFGARGYRNGWLPLYSTASSTPNVLILRNGDPVSNLSVPFRYGHVKAYLKAYLSADHKTVQIGDRDYLILMELDEADPNAKDFNLQDIAVLVTFK